ncbi:PH domain-containing protein [Candidatus Enterococcus murrayae]|uniref:Bacterial Pleckstrin homology domain-containing protein n=1 Tax=Candidatus Enterococcus murrayae TaxID=2815321 RepID=A0ABS3HM77_9ENTE|nr:PH domain-containing protein [Enterococcus sp. MJM16]MBO0454555.1 hypothetical protein [Enterococcus sp. MJM16]
MMSLMILIILIACNFIMAFVSSLAAKPHNYVIIENTFPADKIDDPKVIHFAKKYRERQFQLAFILSFLDLGLLIPMKDSSFMLLFFLLLYATIGANYLTTIRYIRKGHQLIIDNDWQLTTQPIQIDTKLVLEKNRKLVSPWWFSVSLVLILLLNALVYQQGMRDMGLMLLGINVLVWGSLFFTWRAIGRLPVRALTNDQQINQQYNDLTKFYWSSLSVFMSGLISLIVYIPLLTMTMNAKFFSFMMILELIMILLLCGASLWWLISLRQKQDRLLTSTTTFRYSGDDYYWRYGLYYNPDDRRLMVPDRIGMNLSVNLGKIGGKILVALVAVILVVAMVIAVVPLYILDYHPDPLSYEVKDEAVVLDGPFIKEQKIPFAQIEEVELVNHLPFRGIRTNGFATENYATGHYRLDGKPAILFVDHDSKPILKIVTKDRNYFYTNKKPVETKKLYQKIHQSGN